MRLRVPRGSRPPTDFELLREIRDAHLDDFVRRVRAGAIQASAFVPIDIQAIASRLDVEPESVFGRLYHHLNPKYAEPPKHLFTPALGNEQNCVNFPVLEAVLAGLWQERQRDLWALGTAAVSLVIATASILVSVFV
jgi:hypothetical protein